MLLIFINIIRQRSWPAVLETITTDNETLSADQFIS